jgi:5'-nucleotidase (lipoprotein e(P4) family)
MRITNSSAARAPWLALAFVFLTCSASAIAQSNQPPADKEYEAGAVVWQQSSGEYRALAYQTFALAKMLLDRDLRNHRVRIRRAIVVDLDETILDNSRYEAMLVNQKKSYPNGWAEWINRAEATAIPGALEFVKYANSRGVRVFYVTNRKPEVKEGTSRSLKKLGFPAVNEETLLMRDDPAIESKEVRRQGIMAKYHVVLLMGDDLNDFAKAFEDSKTVESRIAASDRFKNEFGKRFIVLPNAMYGNWEIAIYGGSRLSEEEKAAKRKNQLKSY